LPGAERARKLKAKKAAGNLISLIKRLPQAGVNAQPMDLIELSATMELAGIRKYFFQ
jgi:hypothetical protein